MNKQSLRSEMRTKRRAITRGERECSSRRICDRLLENESVRNAIASGAQIAVYLASPDEIDLTGFIVAALGQGAALVAPRWNGAVYEMVPLESLENLVSGPHDILEPLPDDDAVVCPKVWILPGLAFTLDGKRMGYGGGWYDRFLSAADPLSVKLGVAYRFQIVDDLPTEPHDMPLDGVVTD